MRGCLLLGIAGVLLACGGPQPDAIASRSTAWAPELGDSEPVTWAGTGPLHYPVHGIDVSKYQGAIDWDVVRRSGVSFAFIKATEGGDRVDERFAENWAGTRDAELPRGAYHFFYFCRSAAEQAEWFIQNVPKNPGALPPVLDMEWNHTSPTCRYRPTPERVRQEVAVFLGRVGTHYGKQPIIYSTPDFYSDNELWKLNGGVFWLRSVAGHPSTTYPGQHWAFWQYTGTGLVPGITGDTDLNVFGGSLRDWNAFVASNAR